MQDEVPFIYLNNLSLAMQAPPIKGLHDAREISEVFHNPQVGLYDPNEVGQKQHMLPNVPGAPPTTGLMQVCYDHQPIYDRGKFDQAGPVRAFFRTMLRQQRQVRQT